MRLRMCFDIQQTLYSISICENKSMKTISYLVYGNKREYHLELTYSVLSAAHFIRKISNDIQIVLITTASGRRDDLPVHHIIVDDAELARWMLDGKYNHAAKYWALLRAMDEFRGKVILIDTDTYFIQHPGRLFEQIGPGQTLMHDYDTPLGDHEEWLGLLAKINRPLAGYAVTAASPMFNSGVVGVDWSMRSRISDVYDLMTELFAIEPVFNVEQYAFSAVLGMHASLSVCREAVRHYWGFDRRFVHAQLDELFPRFSKDLFDRHVVQMRSLGMPKKPLLDRLRARAMRLLRGNNKQYGFAYLSYLCSLSSDDARIADVWANTALDALISRAVNWSEGSLAHVKGDFCSFRSERLEGHLWMRPETRQRWRQYWNEFRY